jgi:PKD repeat protein
MGNDGFPGALGLILAAAVLGALLAAGLIVGLFISSAVPETPGPLVATLSVEVVGNEVVFSADGTAGGTVPYAEYEWDFGDGNAEGGAGAEFRDVIHEYSGPDTYIVALTVTDAGDNTDTTHLSVTVA